MRGPRPSLVLALSLLTIAAAYSNAVDVGFMWDDHTLIKNNPAAHQLTPVSAFFGRSFWAHPFSEGTSQGYFRPLVALSFAVDWALGGGSPVAFHLTNLFAHLGVAVLVFAVALQLGAKPLGAGAATLFFGLYPRLTESVIWVVGRTDVLATFFGLLALWLELRKPGEVGRRLAVGVALLLGLFCKEVTLAIFVVIAGQSVGRVLSKATSLKREALAAVPLVVALAAFMVLRSQSGTATRAATFNDLPSALNALGHLVFLGLTPWFPNAQYGLVTSHDGWAMGLAVIFLLASIALISRSAWLWLGVLVAMLSVAIPQLGYLTVTSDRFLYLPVALGACLLAPKLELKALLAGVAALAVSFAPVTWLRNREWASQLGFWRHTIAQASPENLGPRNGYADALLEVHRVDDALAEFRALLARNPRVLRDSIELGVAVCLSIRGDDAEAIAMLDTLDTKKKRVAFDRALFLARALDFEGARAAFTVLEAQYGRDEPLTQLATAIREASDGWAAARTPMQKAKVFDGLGALGHAQAQYELVLTSADAAAADRTAALAWLVIKGPLPSAEAALVQLEREGAAADIVGGLRSILEDRR